MSLPSPQRRARHLHDPANPRARRKDPMSTRQVQHWVMSTLVVFTTIHLAEGLVAAAWVLRDDDNSARPIGLLVIAAVLAMAGVAGGFVIHERSPVTPWVLAGAIPSLVGTYLIFLR